MAGERRELGNFLGSESPGEAFHVSKKQNLRVCPDCPVPLVNRAAVPQDSWMTLLIPSPAAAGQGFVVYCIVHPSRVVGESTLGSKGVGRTGRKQQPPASV